MGKCLDAKLIKTGYANKAKFRDTIFLPGIQKELEKELEFAKKGKGP